MQPTWIQWRVQRKRITRRNSCDYRRSNDRNSRLWRIGIWWALERLSRVAKSSAMCTCKSSSRSRSSRRSTRRSAKKIAWATRIPIPFRTCSAKTQSTITTAISWISRFKRKTCNCKKREFSENAKKNDTIKPTIRIDLSTITNEINISFEI